MLHELSAERQILAIEAATVPHMTKEARAETLRRYQQRASGETHAKTAIQALQQAGIEIVREPKRADAAPKRRDRQGRDKGVKRGR